MTVFHRRSVFAFFLGATLAAAVLVGRSAFATTEAINACFKPSNGTLYLLGDSTGRQACQPGDIPISWNTSGVNGQDGVSVTSEPATSQNSPCQNGGSRFTAVSGVTYACNGSNGVDGDDGQDGQDGADGASVTLLALAPGDDTACPNGGTKFTVGNSVSYACNGSNGEDGQDGQFSGTFESPNHLFKLVVDDTTAKIEGSGGSVQITPSGVLLVGPAGNMALTNTGTSLTSAGAITLNAAASLVAQANSASLTSAGQLAVQVGSATLNSTGSLGVQANSASLTSAGSLTVQANSASLNSTGAFVVHSNALFSASGALTSIGGTPIILNGNQCGLLRSTDVVAAIPPGGGPTLSNPNGSPTVRTTC